MDEIKKSIQREHNVKTKYESNIVPVLATSCLFLKMANVGIHFKWSGREFHNFAHFIEKAVWANYVLRKGKLQLPFNADRVVDLVPLCCLGIILQRGVEQHHLGI